MIDHNIYGRYNTPLVQKMFELEASLRDFHRVLKSCSPFLARTFLEEASILGEKLAGNPGDGALEVYRELQRDLSEMNSFIQRWHTTETEDVRRVVAAANHVRDGLQQLQQLVEDTPPQVMDEIKSRLSRNKDAIAGGSRRDNLLYVGALLYLGWCLIDGGVSNAKLVYAIAYLLGSPPLILWWRGGRKWAFNLLFVSTLLTAVGLRILSGSFP